MEFAIAPPPTPSAAIAGSARRFPVRRIYCVGRNYADHAVEMGHSGREPPFFFLKPGDALHPVEAGEVGDWPYPTLTCDLHHEVELVVMSYETLRTDIDTLAQVGDQRTAARSDFSLSAL